MPMSSAQTIQFANTTAKRGVSSSFAGAMDHLTTYNARASIYFLDKQVNPKTEHRSVPVPDEERSRDDADVRHKNN